MFTLETRKAGVKERERGLGIDNSFRSQKTLIKFSVLYLKLRKGQNKQQQQQNQNKQTNKYAALQLNLRVLHMSGKCST